MDFFLNHPENLVWLALFIFILANWWEVIFIYSDTKKRNIKNKLGWAVLAFLMGQYMLPIYYTATKRVQTTLTSSPLGMIAGEKLQKTSKNSKIILAIAALLWLLFAIIFVVKKNTDIVSFLSSRNAENFIFSNFLMPVLLFLYSLLSIKYQNKLNPLDKPLWGMKETQEGYLIDESLTKHKKAVICLIIFILLIPVFLFVYLYLILKTGL